MSEIRKKKWRLLEYRSWIGTPLIADITSTEDISSNEAILEALDMCEHDGKARPDGHWYIYITTSPEEFREELL